ncbi:hypothetical protein J0H58_20420 [bacterium]|nr:hypothetical protein [bacterium]
MTHEFTATEAEQFGSGVSAIILDDPADRAVRLPFTFDEVDALVSLGGKEAHLRDVVRAVAHGIHTGAWIWGEGGIGKSFTVVDELKQSGKPWRLANSSLTAKGIFELLEKYPDDIHLIEDAEEMLKDKKSAGVLRSALWSGPEMPRLVTWIASKDAREFVFNGGIVFTMNKPIDDIRTLRALKTRITHLEFAPTPLEVSARVRVMAMKGGEGLTPEVTIEVTEFVIAEAARNRRPLDWRLVVNAMKDRRQCDAGLSRLDWRDLVRARLNEKVTDPTTSDASIAREINAKPLGYHDKVREWKERTGKSEATFNRQRK